ncbi:hypothetical protein SNE40_008113 [Patella caerulea]|uniref:Uncharacterized protein n=1 Tax=Patella caerulea TaxID=87958 RepID=A0AAN8K619_PATCE
MMIAGVLITLALFGCLVDGQIDVNHCNDFATNIAKCQAEYYPSLVLNTYEQLQGLFTRSSNDFCGNNTETLKERVGCFVDVYRGCGTDQTKKLVASSNNYKYAIDLLCTEGGDRTCGIKYLFNCLTVKMTEHNLAPPNDVEAYPIKQNYYCRQIEFVRSCFQNTTVIPECDRSITRETDLKMAGKLTPEACFESSYNGAMALVSVSHLLAAFLIMSVYKYIS